MSAYSEEARKLAGQIEADVRYGQRSYVEATLATFAERVAAQARRAALDEAAKVICGQCDLGRAVEFSPALGQWIHPGIAATDGPKRARPCGADAIRALAEAGQAEEPAALIRDHDFVAFSPKYPDKCNWLNCGKPRAAHKEEPTP